MHRRRLTLPLLAALVPVFAWRTGVHFETAGRAFGAEIGAAFGVLQRQLAPNLDATDPAAFAPDDADVDDSAVEVEATPTESGPGHANAKRNNGRSRASRSVFIGQRTVLELAQRGVVPAGAWVGPRGNRPAGILLARVSALGVGMADGDVLSAVEGRPVQTEAQIAALVLAARARHASNVSAVFWRGGAPWTLIVEMPYPQGSGGSD